MILPLTIGRIELFLVKIELNFFLFGAKTALQILLSQVCYRLSDSMSPVGRSLWDHKKIRSRRNLLLFFQLKKNRKLYFSFPLAKGVTGEKNMFSFLIGQMKRSKIEK